jgi:methylated-DNA-protein-cysteine methyltransferase-like protein
MKQIAESSFFEKVHQAAREIPYGRVSTYGAIAAFIGAPKAAKMVGWAMNGAHVVFPPVPAHRVVNRNGLLTGKNHFEYPEKMQELLEEEGIEVVNNKVKDFKTVVYFFE